MTGKCMSRKYICIPPLIQACAWINRTYRIMLFQSHDGQTNVLWSDSNQINEFIFYKHKPLVNRRHIFRTTLIYVSVYYLVRCRSDMVCGWVWHIAFGLETEKSLQSHKVVIVQLNKPCTRQLFLLFCRWVHLFFIRINLMREKTM